jgi:hypothetical protein
LAVTVTKREDINIPQSFIHFVDYDITNSAQFEHRGGSPLVQVTHDAGGALSNEEVAHPIGVSEI